MDIGLSRLAGQLYLPGQKPVYQGYWRVTTTAFYAGGKKDAYKTACIPAYMIMKMTGAWPRDFLLLSHRELAIHQYQTGYPDARRVTICTWDVVRFIKAKMAWLAANDLMRI